MKNLAHISSFLLFATVFASACGDSNEKTNTGGLPDAGGTVAADCVDLRNKPAAEVTHLDILNACTDAVKVDKTPNIDPSKLQADGRLPPLP